MTREELLTEFIQALIGGELITLVVFMATHELYHGAEILAWWIAVHMIATYCVWTVLDILDRVKDGPQPLARRESLRKKIS